MTLHGREMSLVDLRAGTWYNGVLRIMDANRSSQRAPLRLLLAEAGEEASHTVAAVLWERRAEAIYDPAPGSWIRLGNCTVVRASAHARTLGPPTVAHVELYINNRHPAVAQKVEWTLVTTPAGRPLTYTIPCRKDGPPRVAELCSGAFGPFTAAAKALGMDPVIEVDRDVTRIALLQATRQVIPGARVALAWT